jgi:hypothetical protein
MALDGKQQTMENSKKPNIALHEKICAFFSVTLLFFCLKTLYFFFTYKVIIDDIFFTPYIIISFVSLLLSLNIEKKFNIVFIIISYLFISLSLIIPFIYYIIEYGIVQNYSDLSDMFVKGQYGAHIGLMYGFLLLIYDIFLFRLYLKLWKN